MTFTITSIQHVEEVGAIVDVFVDGETTLENGTPMGQILKITVPVDGSGATTISEIELKARQQTVRFLREVAAFIEGDIQ